MLYGQAFRESRCSGGMYYTSIKNIYKVIDLLFLNSVKAELEELLYMNILSDGTLKNLSMNFSENSLKRIVGDEKRLEIR